MEACSSASTKAERTRLRCKCEELIKLGEYLKSNSGAQLSGEEAIILRDAAQLHGNHFPPWKTDPEGKEFEAPLDGKLYE